MSTVDTTQNGGNLLANFASGALYNMHAELLDLEAAAISLKEPLAKVNDFHENLYAHLKTISEYNQAATHSLVDDSIARSQHVKLQGQVKQLEREKEDLKNTNNVLRTQNKELVAANLDLKNHLKNAKGVCLEDVLATIRASFGHVEDHATTSGVTEVKAHTIDSRQTTGNIASQLGLPQTQNNAIGELGGADINAHAATQTGLGQGPQELPTPPTSEDFNGAVAIDRDEQGQEHSIDRDHTIYDRAAATKGTRQGLRERREPLDVTADDHGVLHFPGYNPKAWTAAKAGAFSSQSASSASKPRHSISKPGRSKSVDRKKNDAKLRHELGFDDDDEHLFPNKAVIQSSEAGSRSHGEKTIRDSWPYPEVLFATRRTTNRTNQAYVESDSESDREDGHTLLQNVQGTPKTQPKRRTTNDAIPKPNFQGTPTIKAKKSNGKNQLPTGGRKRPIKVEPHDPGNQHRSVKRPKLNPNSHVRDQSKHDKPTASSSSPPRLTFEATVQSHLDRLMAEDPGIKALARANAIGTATAIQIQDFRDLYHSAEEDVRVGGEFEGFDAREPRPY